MNTHTYIYIRTYIYIICVFDYPISRNTEWVPFDVDTDPTTDSSDVWGFAPMRYVAGDLNIPLKTGTKDLTSTSVLHPKVVEKNKKVKKRGITIHEERQHTGELWYIFQVVDTSIDVLEKSLIGKSCFVHKYFTVV